MRRFSLLTFILVSPALAGATPHDRYLADLSVEQRAVAEQACAALPAGVTPAQVLDAVMSTAPAYRFRAGLLTARTDRRWHSTLPPDGPGAPTLVLRRWPADTVVAFYALRAPTGTSAGPRLENATLSSCKAGVVGYSARCGSLDTPTGKRPLHWLEGTVDDSRALGVLIAPGDAGLGLAFADTTLEESLGVVRHVVVHPEAWTDGNTVAPDETLRVPTLRLPPREYDEGEDSWQTAEGVDFTLGIPPGVVVKRTGTGAPAPMPVDGQLMWLRGRFVDRDGIGVIIGDGQNAGYVAEAVPPDEAWAAGRVAPRPDPSATRVAIQPFDLARRKTRAEAATAERWKASSFEGEWLVFRLVFEGRGVEIGLPVLSGRRSTALYWIPLTWRPAGSPPAPPPIDPAERFGVRFERLLPQMGKEHPFTEGHLSVPGARLEVPKDWYPVATLRSRDGFPIRFVNPEGHVVARFEPVEPAALDEASEEGGFGEVGGRTFRAALVLRSSDGARWLYRSDHVSFELRRVRFDAADDYGWERMTESLQLNRPKGRRPLGR